MERENTLSALPEIDRVVVLGAGVMGARIAALLANAGLRVDLLDLPGEEGEAELARIGIEQALKSRPPAFFLPELAGRVAPGSFQDLSCAARADWVIEAIVEDMAPKKALLAQVAEVAGPDTIVSSNTSGLSIEEMAREQSPEFRKRFLGIHFFNPPRHMKLVELIPGPDTDPALVAGMRRFVEEVLGKGGVEARDTPNFIANRLGVFALMEALHRMGRENLGVEAVDGLTGPLLGRPRSATLRLCDLIGLDTLAHVAGTARDRLEDDPHREMFALPGFVQDMLQRGLVGAKGGAGFYCKAESGDIQALDLETFAYRDRERVDLGALEKASREAALEARLQAVWDDPTRLGQWAWGHVQEVLVYAAAHAAEMAADIVQIDRAMKWGFNWEAGPFELWDLLGVRAVSERLEREGVEVPALVRTLLEAGETRFYPPGENGGKVFSLREGKAVIRPVGPEEELAVRLDPEGALIRNDSAYLVEVEEGIGALVFQGKMNVLRPPTLELVQQTLSESPFAAVVLWGAGSLFSAGADLGHIVGLAEAEDWDGLEAFVQDLQEVIMALRYAPFPVVAAPRGLTLGGGCEFCLGADARVVAAELQIGLVETRVGLIPAGGGCKEMVRRQGAAIEKAFRTIFAGQFSDNALQARQWALLDPEDDIVMAEDQLLLRAVARARALVEAGYAPPTRVGLPVAGDEGRQALEAWLDEQVQNKAITLHEQTIGRAVAQVLCGGVGRAREVDESRLLELEREAFLHLCGLELTRARMQHLLKTGKPLRN